MTNRTLALAAAAAVLLLAGCATTAGAPSGSGGGDLDPVIAAPGLVSGIGTVIQIADAPPELCLGPVAESYPPQCSGIPVAGWDWSENEGSETSGDVTWGAYLVRGNWDGVTFTATEATQLALIDTMPIEDPLRDPANAGDTSDADLADIQAKVDAGFPVDVLSTSVENGYVFVQVVYDDGSVQAWADAEYLPDVIAIRPALTDIG